MKHHWFLWLLILVFAAIAWAFDPVGSCTGDVNGDRRVNKIDVQILLANYGRDPARWTQGDVNDDGRVDVADLLVVVQTYGCQEY